MGFETVIPPSLSEMMDQRAMRQLQMHSAGQESQLRQLQMQQAQQGMQDDAQLRQLLPQLMQGGNPQDAISKLSMLGPKGMEMAGKLATIQQAMAKEDKPLVVGRSLMKPDGTIVGTDTTWADEQKAGREAKMQEWQARIQDNATSRADRLALQREMMNLRIDQQKEAMALRKEALNQNNPSIKPLPPGALKMQQSEIEAIGIAGGIQADLGAIEKQINTGKLDFGPISNLKNKALNMAGQSTENSRNFASFKSTLEKLRNDSLRLNTGVQTDGDAQRAWSELFDNITDKGVVLQRLGEIKKLNARAVELRKMNIDGIRSNYGRDPMDVSAYANQKPALNVPSGVDSLLEKYK